jgi:hypothetical protein
VIQFDNKFRVLEPAQEACNLAQRNLPIPSSLSRANGLINPLGEAPARAWVLLQRRDLNQINLDGLHSLTIADDAGRKVQTPTSLVFTREPENISPGYPNDPLAIYLCELADARWRVQNPYYSIPVSAQYNVRAPAYGGAAGSSVYYTNTLNGGVAWTWSTLCANLWGLMANQLGTFPGLPITPDGTPEGWIFLGVPAWHALCEVLWKIGCAVAWNPTATTGGYSVVALGAAGATDALITAADGQRRKLDQGEFLAINRGRVPYGVNVFFRIRSIHAGSEETATSGTTQWQTQAVTSVQINGPATAATEPGVYTPLWDDLPALADAQGIVTNGAALAIRAQARANSFYAELLTGGNRLRKVFDGIVPAIPSGTIRGVAWKIDGQGGLTTEVVRHPWRMLAVDDQGQWVEGSNTPLQPPDLAPSHPVYPGLLQVLRLVSGVPDASGRYDAFVQHRDASTLLWYDRERVWGIPLDNETTQPTTTRYQGRLNGWNNGRPLYDFFPYCCTGGSGVPSGTGSGGSGISCGGCIIPTTLCAALSAAQCPSLNGQVVVLTFVPAHNRWEGTLTLGGQSLSIYLNCEITQWFIQVVCNGSNFIAATPSTSFSCSPFELQFLDLDGAWPLPPNCCGSANLSATLNVTVTPCGGGGGGGGGGGITSTGLGTSATGATLASSTTLSNVTVQGGSLLVVNAMVATDNTAPTLTFGGVPLSLAVSDTMPGGGGNPAGYIGIYYLHVLSTTTASIVLTAGGPAASLGFSAVQVSGLANNAYDRGAANKGSGIAPDTGPTSTTSSANEYAQAAFALENAGAAVPSWTWGGSFTSGGQDIIETISGNGWALTEGYRILAAIGTVDAVLAGTPPTQWTGCVATFN